MKLFKNKLFKLLLIIIVLFMYIESIPYIIYWIVK